MIKKSEQFLDNKHYDKKKIFTAINGIINKSREF